jgi:hypothetical protein
MENKLILLRKIEIPWEIGVPKLALIETLMKGYMYKYKIYPRGVYIYIYI